MEDLNIIVILLPKLLFWVVGLVVVGRLSLYWSIDCMDLILENNSLRISGQIYRYFIFILYQIQLIQRFFFHSNCLCGFQSIQFNQVMYVKSD